MKKSPPGRFLKQDKETGLWHDIGYKQALAKTRQALREGAPMIVKQIQRNKEEKQHTVTEQHRHLQSNLEGAMNAAMQHRTSLASTNTLNALMPTAPESSIVDLLTRSKQRATTAGLAQSVTLRDSLGPNYLNLFGANNITLPSLNGLNQLMHSNSIIPTNSSRLTDREANAILSGNVDALLANISGASSLPSRSLMDALSNQQLATPQGGSRLLGSHLAYEQALSQARSTLKREDAMKEALYLNLLKEQELRQQLRTRC